MPRKPKNIVSFPALTDPLSPNDVASLVMDHLDQIERQGGPAPAVFGGDLCDPDVDLIENAIGCGIAHYLPNLVAWAGKEPDVHVYCR